MKKNIAEIREYNKNLLLVCDFLIENKIEKSYLQITKKTDVNMNYIRDLKNNKSCYSDKFLENLCNIYNVNKDFVLTGKGEMLKTDKPTDNQSTKEQITYKTLPLIPIDAIAGVPAGDFSGVRFEDCEQYRIPDFESKGAEFLIRVNGSSMYPKYSNGDILACKKIEEILFIQWGKVYVIDSSQGSLVKRLFEDKENKEYLICVSDNQENYPPFSIPKSDIRSLSIVVGVIRLE